MLASAPLAQQLYESAERLLGQPVKKVSPAGSGANSCLFRLETAQGPVALKSYPARARDNRRRAEVEWQALTFLHKHGLSAAPTPIARDPTGQFLLMEWIEGTPVTTHGQDDIEDAARFISEIFELSGDRDAVDFSLASEACLSAAEILSQIECRLTQFAADPLIEAFLAEDFAPAIATVKNGVSEELANPSELERSKRRLIPADFGFHNALRENGGMLRFVDFDYFGWDDPAKLTADFILHPAMQLNADETHTFIDRMIAALPEDKEFPGRLWRHIPLYALRWALIMLNPFRSDRTDELPGDEAERGRLIDNRILKARAMAELAQSGIVF